jgi:hypothetical protein
MGEVNPTGGGEARAISAGVENSVNADFADFCASPLGSGVHAQTSQFSLLSGDVGGDRTQVPHGR